MRFLLILLWALPALAGLPCFTETAADTDTQTYVLTQDGSRYSLYRCAAGVCRDWVGQMAAGPFLDRVVDGMDQEKTLLDSATGCVESRVLEEDDLLKRLNTLPPAEKQALTARHEATLSAVRELRRRMDALRALTASFKSKLGETQLTLSPTDEPLLRRLVLDALK